MHAPRGPRFSTKARKKTDMGTKMMRAAIAAICVALALPSFAAEYVADADPRIESLENGKITFAFDAALTDPLAWLYADSKIAAAERLDEIDVPTNGVVDVNILVNGLKPGERLEFEASEKDGEWYRMRAVPVARNTGVNGCLEMTPGKNPYVARRAPFEVFDVLEPLAEPKITSAKETEGLYFRIQNPPKGAKSFDIRFRIKQGNEERQLSLKVNVHNVSLPPVGKDSFKYTNWMDFDSMAVSHGLELWSEEHWTMIEKYVRLAARGRQNVGMMRPVFDTDANGEVYLDKEKFSRFLDIYNRAGFWYLEGTHLARFTKDRSSLKPRFSTNITTTVEGALALSKLARMFMEEIEARGLKDRWFQHVADEPGGKSISEYRITAGIVRRYMPGIRTLDAVESPSFAGALDVWCPKVNSFERHHALYDSFRTNFGDRVWCLDEPHDGRRAAASRADPVGVGDVGRRRFPALGLQPLAAQPGAGSVQGSVSEALGWLEQRQFPSARRYAHRLSREGRSVAKRAA